MPEFDRDNPARNVNELLEYLNSTIVGGDLYRGQTKDYPALVPSIYRNLLVEGTQGDEFPLIVKDANEDPSAQHNQKKFVFARHLNRCFGLGLGNILSQQYGLSSETLDVTDDPSIAAYFASRSYPTYLPVTSGDKPGVVYRFRSIACSHEKPDIAPNLPLSSLNWYFEGGMHDGVLFEDFLFESQINSARESNLWTGEAKSIEIATRGLVLTCEEILKIIDLEREVGENRRYMKDNDASRYMMDQIFASDWSDSRLVRQRGGLIRPRMVFDADVSQNFQVAKKRSDRGRILGVTTGSMLGFYADDEFKPPLAVPGLAIKRELKSIENIRHRQGVEAFYFNHAASDNVDYYRSALWPEPDEDDVMAAIWERLLVHKMVTGEDEQVAVDDPDNGYLDNGYRVDGVFVSASDRRSELYFRGIIQDAEAALAKNYNGTKHQRNRIMALIRMGEPSRAIELISEIENDEEDEYFCCYARYQAYWQLGDREQAIANRKTCISMDPNDCRSRFLLAIELAGQESITEALREIENALANLDVDDISIRRSDILQLKEAVEQNNVKS